MYGLSWDTSTADILTQTRWDSLERMYKVQSAEFPFKCIKEYNATEFKDLFVQKNSSRETRKDGEIVLPSPETNFMRNSIKYRGAIAWNSLSCKESAANNLNQFKLLLLKFDNRKINCDSVAAVIKHKDDDYIYFQDIKFTVLMYIAYYLNFFLGLNSILIFIFMYYHYSILFIFYF